jgi:quinohemoprotein ethanol dehydrogenase
LSMDFFYNIVLDGALKDAGMASFKSALSRDDVTAIRNFIIHRANEDSKAASRH